ncbi:aminotransferase class V-fold PLP-dependent enzyme [Candidatus Gracilibacteria bacterium]|nr:aminotransferase class V-fold PLP-dependent enzyme [Candidatus Gracilibacteria bacterium]
MSEIYLDHAAATPIYPEVLEKISEAGKICFGNPSSIHQEGIKVKTILDETRYGVAKFFECKIGEVVFTSGATESLNLAIIGNYLHQRVGDKTFKGTIFISPLVHASITGACTFLEKHFGAEIKFLPIENSGFLNMEQIDAKIFDKANIIVCEHGNSEIGIVQPIAKLGKKIKKYREEKEKGTPVFIVDTAASVVTEKISLSHQVCDMLTVSGEKFGAGAGSGILIKQSKVLLSSLFHGSHEFGLRGGTENWLGILGLKEALKLHEKNRVKMREHFKTLQEFARKYFIEKFPEIKITTPRKNFLPHIFHFRLLKESGELFVQKCDLDGVCISAGAACSSGNVSGSSILKNIGCSDKEAKRGIRISFGRNTMENDLKKAFEIFEKHF